MQYMRRIALLWLLVVLVWPAGGALAATGDEAWAPTPPRLGYIDGEVSYWRPGAEAWAEARPNLALAEGDALYAGDDSNLEVQFGPRSFVRADANSELSLVAQQAHRIQFKVTGGRVTFDVRSLDPGDRLEVSTPNAEFAIEHPGSYRVEVGSRDTHFITRRGGEATVVTADGRSLAIYPSEDVVVTAGNPVQVATYAAPEPDAWDRWNDERSDRFGESVSSRYLPPGVYGAEDLDYYGHWRMVAAYGPVWIPYGVSVGWVPYSSGYWVWDPYYAWTWVDDAPWGWAPCHYGRWVYIDGFWAWAPGPVVRYPLYAPALVAFMTLGPHVSARVSVGLPGLWWVALGWGEPVIPWWGAPRHRGHPWWGGWGGPRIVNDVVVKPTAVVRVGDIHFHNATLPRAVVTLPAEKFGRERVRASVETRYRRGDFAPVAGALPVRPSRASLFGGAPKGAQPPREIVTRPVVSTSTPPERAQPWKDEAPRARAEPAPESRYVVPPARRTEDRRAPQRPPFGAEAGPERTPPRPPPRYGEVRKAVVEPAAPRSEAATREGAGPHESVPAVPPARPAVAPPPVPRPPGTVQAPRPGSESAPRSPAMTRESPIERRVPPVQPGLGVPAPGRPPAPEVQIPRARPEAVPQRGEAGQAGRERPLPGQPASRTYGGRDRGARDAH